MGQVLLHWGPPVQLSPVFTPPALLTVFPRWAIWSTLPTAAVGEVQGQLFCSYDPEAISPTCHSWQGVGVISLIRATTWHMRAGAGNASLCLCPEDCHLTCAPPTVFTPGEVKGLISHVLQLVKGRRTGPRAMRTGRAGLLYDLRDPSGWMVALGFIWWRQYSKLSEKGYWIWGRLWFILEEWPTAWGVCNRGKGLRSHLTYSLLLAPFIWFLLGP